MIPIRVHAVLDYVVGVALLIAPYVLGFATGGVEQWLPQVVGLLTILLSLMTDYSLGPLKVVPFRVHLALDALFGVILALSPLVLGFADRILWPHVIVGLVYLIVPALTRRTDDDLESRATGL